MLAKIESEEFGSMPMRLFEAAWMMLRHVIGMITPLWITRSFIRMNMAARFTGSISCSAFRHTVSYSALRQRLTFRPVHLFSLVGMSHEQNCPMKPWGSRLADAAAGCMWGGRGGGGA